MARPDRELRHEPGRCGWCEAGLAGRPVTGVERRQVFDLPEAAVAVTEHQLIERECGCGQRTRAAAPPGAAIVLTLLAVNLMIVVIYALVSGFTIFFDKLRKTSGSGAWSIESSAASEAAEEKKLSWNERITLIIAVISTIATIAAAIEPIVHP